MKKNKHERQEKNNNKNKNAVACFLFLLKREMMVKSISSSSLFALPPPTRFVVLCHISLPPLLNPTPTPPPLHPTSPSLHPTWPPLHPTPFCPPVCAATRPRLSCFINFALSGNNAQHIGGSGKRLDNSQYTNSSTIHNLPSLAAQA